MSFIVITSACNNNETEFTGTIIAPDQVISFNNIFFQEVSIDKPGWLVAFREINGTTAYQVALPAYIPSSGRYTNNYIYLDSTVMIVDSMTVVLKLYDDNGSDFGQFDANDLPIEVNGQQVATSILLASPRITTNNQSVSENTIVVKEVLTGVRAWIAVYQLDEEGEFDNLVGFEPVDEYRMNNIKVELTDTVTYEIGDKLATVLHANNVPFEYFTYPGNDAIQVFGFSSENIIFDTFEVQ